MGVAFHKNDGNHDNDENDEENSDSYKLGVECCKSANKGLPLPLGRGGSARPNPKKGRSRDRKSFTHRV